MDIIPKIKKRISSFLTSEEGKISKQSLLVLGTLASASIALSSTSVHAQCGCAGGGGCGGFDPGDPGSGEGSGSGSGGCGCGNGGDATPYIAVWNGKTLVTENDILFGYPSSRHSNYFIAKYNYENSLVTGDLYKLQTKLVGENDKLRLQLQEYDFEESFIDKINLYKVVHEKGTIVIVKNDFKEFLNVGIEELKKSKSPLSCIDSYGNNCAADIDKVNNIFIDPLTQEGLTLDFGNYIDLEFGKFDKNSILLINTRSMAWYLKNSSYKINNFSSHEQFDMKGLHLFYQDSDNKWTKLTFMHTRNTRYNLEYIDLRNMPKFKKLRIISNSPYTIKINFIGILEDFKQYSFELEILKPKLAYHHRLKKDFADITKHKNYSYMHTMRGDIVDLEFEDNGIISNKKVTYLVASDGFYTGLRKNTAIDIDFGYVEHFFNYNGKKKVCPGILITTK